MILPAYPKYKVGGFSWLPQVPEHWQIQRLKTVAACRVSNVDKVPTEHEEPVRLCNYTDVYHNDAITLDMPLMETTATAEEIKRFRLEVGDVVLTKDSEEWSDIAVPALVKEAAPNLVCGYHLAFIRPDTHRLNGAYLHRCLQAKAVNYQFQVAASGVTRYGLANSAIGNAWIVLPPPPEQRAIAAFLERETARLDGLVAQKEKLLALLEEKRASLITHAVTGGLDAHAPTKPSGIPWLGNIPKHWDIQRLQRLVRYGTSITYGIVQAGPDVEDGIPYIRTSDMAGDTLPREGYLRTTPEIDASYRRSKVQAGDLVVAIRATVGKTLPVPDFLEGANLTQGTAKIAPGARVNAGYLYWVLNSQASQQGFATFAKGVTFREITLEMLRKFVVPLPPLVEQKAINAMLVERTDKFTNLLRQVRSGIEKLGERRTALISAAVTGQIDVRNWKPA